MLDDWNGVLGVMSEDPEFVNPEFDASFDPVFDPAVDASVDPMLPPPFNRFDEPCVGDMIVRPADGVFSDSVPTDPVFDNPLFGKELLLLLLMIVVAP